MMIGGMLTTLFFARLWRRAGVLTELEFLELRYAGKAAKFLRGFRALYLGLFFNVIIIGWVNAAMMILLDGFFGIPASESIWIVFGLMALVAFYSTLSGLIGVAVTDMVQFSLAMIGCIVLAFYVLDDPRVGGIAGLKEQLPAWRFDFFPTLGTGTSNEVGGYSLSIGAFLTFVLVQWYSSWYPGAEPGGGGYVAQRMMSAKNERHALGATLLFQVAHYALRPWPWIIVGLGALVLYPDLPPEKGGVGYVQAMRDLLPSGLRGLLLVAFLGAYMSTISTQLNWGAGFLSHDLIGRFFPGKNWNDKKAVRWARISTVVLMLVGLGVTTQLSSIDQAAQFLIACGAGIGLVLILRWFWWRVNAWSEIAATAFPLLAYPLANYALKLDGTEAYLLTVGSTTFVWLLVTFLTPSEPKETLAKFYAQARPKGLWKPYQTPEVWRTQWVAVAWTVAAWFGAVLLGYGLLFGIGKVIFAEGMVALAYFGLAAFGTLLLVVGGRKAGLLAP